jgi:hypothetical protein
MTSKIFSQDIQIIKTLFPGNFSQTLFLNIFNPQFILSFPIGRKFYVENTCSVILYMVRKIKYVLLDDFWQFHVQLSFNDNV